MTNYARESQRTEQHVVVASPQPLVAPLVPRLGRIAYISVVLRFFDTFPEPSMQRL